jgi:hypothetical protein
LHKPSETALKARARTLLESMTDRARWVYALPIAELREHLAPVLAKDGFVQTDVDQGGRVARWSSGEEAAFTVLEREDLEVALVEAHGEAAAAPLGDLLEKTGFFAQSALLASAYEVGTEDARKALTTLAHMVVAWDADWADLFVLHLASPDPVVRHDAIAAVTVAAMVARSGGPAAELLAEAQRRETYPKLKETIDEAAKLVAAIAP